MAPVSDAERTADDASRTEIDYYKSNAQAAGGGYIGIVALGYKPGVDPFWDQLGPDWQAVDGLTPRPVRVYVLWETSDDGKGRHIAGFCVAGGPVTASLVRSIPIGRLERLGPLPDGFAEGAIRSDLAPLQRIKGEDPEVFADRVATYYRMFSQSSSKPAKEIADHSEVPVATVRGWIREARMRGKLPPGTQGKAG